MPDIASTSNRPPRAPTWREWPLQRFSSGADTILFRLDPEYAALNAQMGALLEGGLAAHPEFRRSRHAVVHRIQPDAFPDRLFFKQFLLRDRWDCVKRFYRESRARRALITNGAINRRGFRTEPVIALAEYRRFGVLEKSMLITREIEQVHEVRSVLRDPEYGLRTDIPRRRRFIKTLGQEIGAWHKAGFHHGDLRLSNLLVRFDDEHCTFYWMDNERTRRYAALSLRHRRHNLMQIIMDPGVFSRTDAMRLWRSYKEAAEFHIANEKTFMRKVIRHTQKRWRARNWL